MVTSITFTKRISAGMDDAHSNEAPLVQWANDLEYVSFGNKTDLGRATYLRWQINIPNNATISSAKVTICSHADLSGAFTSQIRYMREQDGADFTSDAKDRPKSTTKVDWAVPSFTTDSYYDTPDIKTLLNEWMSDFTYIPGNHFIIILGSGDAATDERRSVYSYEGGSSKAALLTIEYTIPYKTTLSSFDIMLQQKNKTIILY